VVSAFLVIGGIGVAVLAASWLLGAILDFGHVAADGPFSLAAMAAFVSAFGFGGAAIGAVLPELGNLSLLISVLAGLAAAIPAAWFAIRLTQAVMHMPTDPTLTRDHLIGATGVVVTRIPEDGYGEVRVRVAGQQIKFNARASQPMPSGTEVFVIGTPSETSVIVEPAEMILPDAG
jgi:membrane protein implicated in regulation of membrane protease activity